MNVAINCNKKLNEFKEIILLIYYAEFQIINSVNCKIDFIHIFKIWYNMLMLFSYLKNMSRNLINKIKIKSIIK